MYEIFRVIFEVVNYPLKAHQRLMEELTKLDLDTKPFYELLFKFIIHDPEYFLDKDSLMPGSRFPTC